ncbi:D-alanyl-D-alanine carboxypeptidase family protein [Oceanibaculum nanhaiense]|jgi:serine-type D-Ala-D-Ala carboxypeptidase (penicillin-binding protein 5/6)|uniref:D-alanyl-D-alanine carboxypeptidase family protein n=1 Tax=Oceanibaculum nanhaiense TaxID=1909734 RepID=UPI000A3BAB03|nr:D-alanyl-D-alanine carboxypeptidase family protein [Oceanibaculum nanhaiense]MBC7134364.1 D-alanyl-D-alanine carboxypeptidase [Oceanibaculum nanhaiense]
MIGYSTFRPAMVGAAIVGAVLLAPLSVGAQEIETPAKQAYILDAQTGTVLLDKDADSLMPPASMSKLMTAYMIFQRLKDGRLTLEDEFLVSEKAWRKGGSKMFVEVGSRVSVEDLLRGIIVQSGNDACIVVAEGIAGSEEAFAEMMTETARKIGLEKSVFRNATGWPDEDHVMTARELAVLAERIIADFPEYYHYYAETSFTYNEIRQGNRNPLLYTMPGADGLKTGHTEASGYGLTASAKRDGRRIILVVNGLPSMNARSQESGRLMDWAFREFEALSLFKAGETVEQAEIWMGDTHTVPLVSAEDIVITVPKAARRSMVVSAVYDGPVAAPVKQGDRIATLRVALPNGATMDYPLQAGADVEELGLFGRMLAAAQHLAFGPR